MSDPVPWTDVAARLRPFVAHRVPSSEIDDVVQDVLVRMHRGLPKLRDDDRFSAWMFQVARNAIADSVRKQAHAPQAAPDLDDTPATPSSGATVAPISAARRANPGSPVSRRRYPATRAAR